jgi:hypothetical protein
MPSYWCCLLTWSAYLFIKVPRLDLNSDSTNMNTWWIGDAPFPDNHILGLCLNESTLWMQHVTLHLVMGIRISIHKKPIIP